MVTKEQVIAALKTVNDPEVHIDVWTMGLIYDVAIAQTTVKILMTLTSPMCPYGPLLIDDLKKKVKGIKGVKEVQVTVTFTPVWKPSEELKQMLGMPSS